MVVMAHIKDSMYDISPIDYDISVESCVYELLKALNYLHENNIIHRNLHPKNILFDSKVKIKILKLKKIKKKVYLSNYGLYYMTNGGEYVDFPIG